jgi:glycosyltransferase involved in cell wall biosynthesis
VKPLRVVVDARIDSGQVGGVETVIIGLATGLSCLTDGGEEYLFYSYAGENGWLLPHLSGRATALEIPRPTKPRRVAIREHAPALAWAWSRLRAARPSSLPLPSSDGTIERVGADVMHFTHQQGFTTRVPSIYQPHDLQHLHLPDLFTPAERSWRERRGRAFCAQAEMVSVASTWTRRDVIRNYGLSPSKVVVVPEPPGTFAMHESAAEEIERIRGVYGLPESYAVYPAATWPHKNHAALFAAMAILRRQGLSIPLVAPGMQTPHARKLQDAARQHGVADLVFFLGFIPAQDLNTIIRLARAVVVPSLFESTSAPLWEAFQCGIPAACSNVTSLPDQAGDAALVFDPRDPDDIARAIQRLWADDALRERLITAGRVRVSMFTWEHTARLFRAHYRRIAGRHLDAADEALIEAPPGI